MNDELEHAKLIVDVRAERPYIIHDINQALTRLDNVLPNHRLSQLANSLAWHERRRAPAERLREFARELARLWKKVDEKSAERHIYELLFNRLALTSELNALQQQLKERLDLLQIEIDTVRDKRQQREQQRSARSLMATLKQEMQLYANVAKEVQTKDDNQRWGTELLHRLHREEQNEQIVLVRLLLALTAINTADTLMRSTELRQMIGKDALVWH